MQAVGFGIDYVADGDRLTMLQEDGSLRIGDTAGKRMLYYGPSAAGPAVAGPYLATAHAEGRIVIRDNARVFA